MKLQEVYKDTKIDYPLYIILIQSGTFYVTYNDDAHILGYLLEYQVNENKVGFPKCSLEKVVSVLNESHISYIVLNDRLEKEFPDNQYQDVLYKAKRKYYNELNAKLLIDEINFLLKSNPENISKIRDFISGL